MSEENVQPETAPVESEGQGNAPYSEYLEKLPEDIRGDVEPIFKEWDSNVTKKFQEAADYKNQWEPYSDLGLNDVPREEVENLLALRNLAESDPEGFDTWLRETASERGILGDSLEDQLAPFDEDGETDPFEEKLNPIMSELEQLREWRESQDQESRVAEAMSVVESQVEEMKVKHPDVPQELAEQFLASYAESDPHNAVPLAFEAAEKWIAQIQQGMMKDKLDQPEAAENGSVADVNPERVTTFAEASKQALARLQNN